MHSPDNLIFFLYATKQENFIKFSCLFLFFPIFFLSILFPTKQSINIFSFLSGLVGMFAVSNRSLATF